MDSSLVTSGLLAVAIVFPILATVAVALRFYAHKIKSQRPRADDWTVVVGLFMCYAISINTFVAASLAGVNSTTLDPLTAATVFLKALWIEGFPLGIGLSVIKISILLFYYRLFTTPIFRLCVKALIWILIGWAISTVIAQLFCANPISGAWNPVMPSLRYNYGDFALAVAGMSIIFDVVVLCFPLPVIKNLHLITRRKIMIASIFWLGGFCCVAAAVRFVLLYKEIYHVSNSSKANRYTYVTQGFIWSHIEPNCSIIAACLPTYGPFFIGNETTKSFLKDIRSFFSSTKSTLRLGRGSKSTGESSDVNGTTSWSGKDQGSWQLLNNDNGGKCNSHDRVIQLGGPTAVSVIV